MKHNNFSTRMRSRWCSRSSSISMASPRPSRCRYRISAIWGLGSNRTGKSVKPGELGLTQSSGGNDLSRLRPQEIYRSPCLRRISCRRLVTAIADEGFQIRRYKVRSLMRQAALKPVWKRRFVHTTDSKHALPIAANVLNRQFNPTAPNLAYVSDITYIRTRRGMAVSRHRTGPVCAQSSRLGHGAEHACQTGLCCLDHGHSAFKLVQFVLRRLYPCRPAVASTFSLVVLPALQGPLSLE
ncbi:MAG: family transposase [Massilia sp.]|nr:family transposase [Massilia sp.]